MDQKTIDAAPGGGNSISPVETVQVTVADGTGIVLRRMSSHPSVRYVLSHGNGLAIAGYEEFWKRLMPDAEIVLFDFRNHGINPPATPSPLNNWINFVSDMDDIIAAIDAHFGAKPTYGVFHSLSALTCLLHASSRRPGWKGLVLFEPPAVPREGEPERPVHIESQSELVNRTRTRRTSYESPEQLSRSFSRIPMFQRMQEAVRLHLAASTLRAKPDGTYSLVCPPDFEADTFVTWEMGPHWEGFAAIDCPVLIVASAAEDSDTPTLSRVSRMLAADFGFDYAEVPDAGHLLQLDHPGRCAGLVRDFVARLQS